jgi:hypothetical protein
MNYLTPALILFCAAVWLYRKADRHDSARWAAAGLVCWIAAGVLCVNARSAPAPKDRPPPPAPSVAVGTYSMTWHGTDCPAYFHGESVYACTWHGTPWAGYWTCRGGVLTVTEWPMDRPDSRSVWSVNLACPRTGKMPGGSPWKVTPLAGKVY